MNTAQRFEMPQPGDRFIAGQNVLEVLHIKGRTKPLVCLRKTVMREHYKLHTPVICQLIDYRTFARRIIQAGATFSPRA